ncbi:hypothetical protein CGRA01v4_11915 [Colletotrichum graminicola]|nr:hypothetical protein CGRA01v4_11915 [Colletotrichum graminicola]
MQLFVFGPLVIALILLTLGAEGATKSPYNAWTHHRNAMEWWILWPKSDDRGLKLMTLPACIRDCITPENSWVDVNGVNTSVHTVKRRVFCDPRLGLVKKYFVRQIGRCTLESCRFEHSLWRLRAHYDVWLKGLCVPPGIRRPKSVWRLETETVLKPMIDPSSNNTDNPTDHDANEHIDWDVYDDYGWDAYNYVDWSAYGDFGWDVDEDHDLGDYDEFDREAKTTNETAFGTEWRNTVYASKRRPGRVDGMS